MDTPTLAKVEQVRAEPHTVFARRAVPDLAVTGRTGSTRRRAVMHVRRLPLHLAQPFAVRPALARYPALGSQPAQ